ncbi:hypothetical protein BGX38DRAFT_1329258 [Terfezia claveryi]|nr:hypothetical protein BGX38DRAFT_1329258 [Terfezia claveryi]
MGTRRGPDYVYLIKGINTGGICPRKEIDDFWSDVRQRALFMAAFQIMSKRPKDDVLSYYQLAGIHSVPYDITWPPDGGPPASVKIDKPGYYCYHFGPLFLTWHRVYVLCIEQALHDIIMQLTDPDDPEYLLSNVTDSGELNKWKTAAETWRLPYWDFALRRSNNRVNGKDFCCIPNAALNEFLDSSNEPNPFYAFVFPGEGSGLPDLTDRDFPMSIQRRTVRHAPAYDASNSEIVQAWERGTSDMNSLKSFFRDESITWRTDLIDLMISNISYEGLIDGTPNSEVPTLNAVHGSVHDNTGGYIKNDSNKKNGNMAIVPAAGFDPIFFLWHCNVDRIGAMWQAANNSWMDDESNVKKLIPFRYSPNEFWTSKHCRYPNNMGYTYPDLTLITNRRSLIQTVINLYSEPQEVPAAGPGLGVDEYVVTAKYETHEVGPFYLKISLKVDDKEVFVTSIVNFVSPLETGCSNCQTASEEHHTATTSTLISPRLRELHEQGKLSGLGPDLSDNIEQKLTKSLQWKCYSLGTNEEISSDKFTSLQVGVSRRVPEEPAPGDGRPRRPVNLIGRPFRTEPLRGISDGKPFGLHSDEGFNYFSPS